MKKAHQRKRFELQRGFARLGFKGLTAFLNVCLWFNLGLNEIDLSKWWRNGLRDPELIDDVHNKLEEILNALRYE